MIDLDKQEHNGVTYWHYLTQQERQAVTCVGEKRITMDGQLKITLTKGSYKFNEELQIRILTDKISQNVKVDTRNMSQWNTTEINMPVAEIPKLIEALTLFEQIRQVKK